MELHELDRIVRQLDGVLKSLGLHKPPKELEAQFGQAANYLTTGVCALEVYLAMLNDAQHERF